MKAHGDIPKEHLDLLDELHELESWFKTYGREIPPLVAAKGYVCMAHDYYCIFLEEEGERLLKEANKVSPNYFIQDILDDAFSDPIFYALVTNLVRSLAITTMISMGFKYEQE